MIEVGQSCYVCVEKIGSLAYLGRKILTMLMLVRKIFFTSSLYDFVKILGNVVQNMTNPPPPPPQC